MDMSADGRTVRILVDNSIYRFTNQDDVVVRPREINIGGISTIIRLAQIERREFDGWRVQHLPALQGIFDLARAHRVQCCTSLALHAEFMESFESIRTASTGNELLAGVDFDFVDSPFERIAPFSNADLGTKSQRLELCRRLRAASRKQTRTKESKGNLEASIGFDRFAELCSGLSELDDKVIDTLHLWTGEAAGIPYFMTFDTTFVNFMTMTSKVKSRCVPVTPSKLFERLRNSDLSSAGQADEN